MSDTMLQSFIKGRGMAAILVLVSIILGLWGIDFSQSAQVALTDQLSTLSASIGAIVAIVSKMRERKREGGGL